MINDLQIVPQGKLIVLPTKKYYLKRGQMDFLKEAKSWLHGKHWDQSMRSLESLAAPESSHCAWRAVSRFKSQSEVSRLECCPQLENAWMLASVGEVLPHWFRVSWAEPAQQGHTKDLFREAPPMCSNCTQLQEVTGPPKCTHAFHLVMVVSKNE